MKHLLLYAYLALALVCVVALADLIWNGDRSRFVSKFAVGDCVEQVYETEFYRNVYYLRIDKVGKEAYMTSQKTAEGKGFFNKENFEWKFALNKHDKVDPMFCEVSE